MAHCRPFHSRHSRSLELFPLLVLHSRWSFVAAGRFGRKTNLRPLCTRMSCLSRAFHLANLHCTRSVGAADYASAVRSQLLLRLLVVVLCVCFEWVPWGRVLPGLGWGSVWFRDRSLSGSLSCADSLVAGGVYTILFYGFLVMKLKLNYICICV